jgi:hypothetical protein
VNVLFVTTPRYDYTTATLVEGLNALEGIELRTTTAGNYARPQQVLGREDALAYGRSAALLILGYNRGVDADLHWSIDNPRAIRIFVDGGDNSELPISLQRARTIHAIFKREYFRRDNSVRNLTSLLMRRSAGMWTTMRRHALSPFPSFEGFRNRTRPIDLLRNIAARSITHKVHPLPYGIENRFRGSVNPEPRYESGACSSSHSPRRSLDKFPSDPTMCSASSRWEPSTRRRCVVSSSGTTPSTTSRFTTAAGASACRATDSTR